MTPPSARLATSNVCHIQKPGSGFLGSLWGRFESQSDLNLKEQDEINEPWQRQGPLTPVCLSAGSRTCSLHPPLVSPRSELVWLPTGFIWMAVRMSWILPVLRYNLLLHG